MNKKLLFFDIDGTLTDRSTGTIVPSAQKAIQQLQEQGHFVAIATGRAHYKARPFMEQVGIKHMVCNGGNGIVLNEKLICNIPLDKTKACAIYHQAYAAGYGVLAMIDDSIDVYGVDERFLNQSGERQEPTNYVIDPTFDIDQAEHIYKLYISVPAAEEDRIPLVKHCDKLRFVSAYLMIQHDRKKEGILQMLEQIGGKEEDVVVFGDDHNDLVMFDDRWFSIAMGNACDALKAKANYITNANIDDGIWNACVHFGWIHETK